VLSAKQGDNYFKATELNKWYRAKNILWGIYHETTFELWVLPQPPPEGEKQPSSLALWLMHLSLLSQWDFLLTLFSHPPHPPTGDTANNSSQQCCINRWH